MSAVLQFLSTVGDGTGTINGASDSSTVAVELKLLPATKTEVRISHLTAFVEDNAALKGDTFGTAALTNGIRIRVLDANNVTIRDLTACLLVKRLGDFLALGASVTTDTAGTNKYGAYRLQFDAPVILNGNNIYRLAVSLHDDLSNLVLLTFLAEGTVKGQLTA